MYFIAEGLPTLSRYLIKFNFSQFLTLQPQVLIRMLCDKHKLILHKEMEEN